jgi:hypothetical protein
MLAQSAAAQNLSNDAIKAPLRPKIDAFYWRSLLLTSTHQLIGARPEREFSAGSLLQTDG